MPAKRQDLAASSPTPRAVAVSKERRALIEAQVAQLSTTARKVAAELPLTADVSDFVRALDEAGSA